MKYLLECTHHNAQCPGFKPRVHAFRGETSQISEAELQVSVFLPFYLPLTSKFLSLFKLKNIKNFFKMHDVVKQKKQMEARGANTSLKPWKNYGGYQQGKSGNEGR